MGSDWFFTEKVCLLVADTEVSFPPFSLQSIESKEIAMKRLIGLSVAVIIGVTLTTVMLIPNEANALDANLTGTCEGLCVESGVLKHVIVQVKGGWTNTDAIELAQISHI